MRRRSSSQLREAVGQHLLVSLLGRPQTLYHSGTRCSRRRCTTTSCHATDGGSMRDSPPWAAVAAGAARSRGRKPAGGDRAPCGGRTRPAAALGAWVVAARSAFARHAVGESSHAYSRCLDCGTWSRQRAGRPGSSCPSCCTRRRSRSPASRRPQGRAHVQRAVDLVDPGDTDRFASLLVRLGRTDLAGPATSSQPLARSSAPWRSRTVGRRAFLSARVLAAMSGLLMLCAARRNRAVELGRQALALAEDVSEPRAIAFALEHPRPGTGRPGRVRSGDRRRTTRAGHGHRPGAPRRDPSRLREPRHRTAGVRPTGRAEQVRTEGGQWARRRACGDSRGRSSTARRPTSSSSWAAGTRRVTAPVRRHAAGLEGVARLHVAMTAGLIAVRTGRLEEAHRRLDASRPALARLRDTQFCGTDLPGLAELAIAEERLADAQVLDRRGAGAEWSETDGIRIGQRSWHWPSRQLPALHFEPGQAPPGAASPPMWSWWTIACVSFAN